MFDEHAFERASFQEDMIKVLDRVPNPDEYRRVRHLILQSAQSVGISDEELARALEACPHIEIATFSGAPTITDRTVFALAKNAANLQELDLSGCSQVTDVALLELKSLPLRSVRLSGAVELTDSSISAIVKTCGYLIELELGNLPSLTPLALRDVWSFSRRIRTLRIPHCPLLTDKAFPFAISDYNLMLSLARDEKPLPHRPNTWLEVLPPLILQHKAESLRVLDLTACNITDEAIDGVVSHAPRIQSLILTACSNLTDRALESVARLGNHLDILVLAHVSNITDQGLIKLTRACANLRCIDLAFCRNLTDMSVFELAGLNSLRRLSLVRVQKLTDMAIFALAEQATLLERLHLSYCDHLSLKAIHELLKKVENLHYLTLTGVPSMKSKCMQRFSDSPPNNLEPGQQSAYRVFSGENILLLRRFLDKESKRRHDAEAQNLPFIELNDEA